MNELADLLVVCRVILVAEVSQNLAAIERRTAARDPSARVVSIENLHGVSQEHLLRLLVALPGAGVNNVSIATRWARQAPCRIARFRHGHARGVGDGLAGGIGIVSVLNLEIMSVLLEFRAQKRAGFVIGIGGRIGSGIILLIR